MKVLFIAPGNSVHTARWIRQCQSEGIQAFLYTTSDFSQVEDNKDLTLIKPSSIADFKWLRIFHSVISIGSRLRIKELVEIPLHMLKIRSTINSNEIDVVHVHWLFHSAAVAASLISGSISVATPWGSDIQWDLKGNSLSLRQKMIRKAFLRVIVKRSTHFCCDALHLKEALVGLGANATDVEIIYFGVDVEKFSINNYSTDFRASIGIKPDDVMVLSNRGLEPVYDVATFIQAAHFALKKITHLKFVVASSGSQRAYLEDLVKELKISDSVVFLGRLSNEEFPIVTASSDIYVSTSTSDGGLAASVAEAMASSVPVLNTNFGENPMWMEDGPAGLCFPIGDYEKLADFIVDLGENPSLRTEMGQHGRAIILKSNNSTIESKKIKSMYMSIVKTENLQ